MNPAQYWLTISMIVAAQAPLRELHAAPSQSDSSHLSAIETGLTRSDTHPAVHLAPTITSSCLWRELTASK
jgi:hypothetical protein